MALGKQFDFSMHRGDSRQITFTVVDENKAIVDITGAVMAWELSDLDTTVDDNVPAPLGPAIVSKGVGTGIVLTDPANGQGRIDLGSGDTVGLTAPLGYYHELQVQLGGETTTVMFGVIDLKRDIAPPGP